MKKNRLHTFLPYFVGALYSLLYIVGDFSRGDRLWDISLNQVSEGLSLLIFLPLALRLWQQFSHEKIIDKTMTELERSSFFRFEQWSWFILLVPNQWMTGIRPSWALTLVMVSTLIICQGVFYLTTLSAEKRKTLFGSERYIAVLFLVSGFSALIYQVVWQRVLFATFGINSEAVTVIVSVFMFGLGIGALVGGILQKRFSKHLLRIFVGLEVFIGLFGLVSLSLIHYISSLVSQNSTLHLIGWTYLILAIPTLLMGATLPILVSFLQQYFQNLGKTVGLLYAFNTIGSAIAAYFTVEVLFVFLGQNSTIIIAALCNLCTAVLILKASQFLRAAPAEQAISAQFLPTSTKSTTALPYWFVFTSLIFIGYISLSQEIIWYRLIGFSSAGRPQVFGILLTAFLIGIAMGSLKAKKLCESKEDPYTWLIRALLIATLVFYLATPSVAFVSALISKTTGPTIAYLLTAIAAYYTGGMLPMLIHIGVNEQKKNSSMAMSWLYFANIIGATLGPLLTGFILLEYFTLEQNVLILSALTLLFLFALLLFIPVEKNFKLKTMGVIIAGLASAAVLHDPLYTTHLERIQFGAWENEPFKYKLENRAGIITVAASDSDSDIIYGGGIYDGKFNTDLTNSTNGIDRAYMFPVLHRNPKKVLEIGLSSGSWAKVLTEYFPLESLTIVEINKGYPQMIRNYPEIAEVLNHPKVSLHFDDGRRWLRNHPNEQFDFILMNTTFHWRSNATNLLSKDFLELCKRHLKPGGVVYYNTTGSKDVVLTASHVFKYVTVYANFVAASDSPFDMTTEEKIHNLKLFKNSEGRTLYDSDTQQQKALDYLSKVKLLEVQESIRSNKNLQLITDDNMAVEFKIDY
ncbi:fused MFS/spermidine synthase [Undibacterium macrobrachii]|nr:fused MFS/spermidine synthase [Undibacterium macrobrachii]